MLLKPNDYGYKKLRQSRGNGDSGQIYIGTPRRENLCTIIVKDYMVSDAINEFIACNIGQKMGINTPRAWLFSQIEIPTTRSRIRFDRAVAIEYLDGMDENVGSSYETEELARQTIQGHLLHYLMKEEDQISLAWYKGKIYAFDFAASLYLQARIKNLPLEFTSIKQPNGLTFSDVFVLRAETSIRRDVVGYINSLERRGISDELAVAVYEDFKRRFLTIYNREGFSDLLYEIEMVFSKEAANYVKDLIGSMQQALVAAV